MTCSVDAGAFNCQGNAHVTYYQVLSHAFFGGRAAAPGGLMRGADPPGAVASSHQRQRNDSQLAGHPTENCGSPRAREVARAHACACLPTCGTAAALRAGK